MLCRLVSLVILVATPLAAARAETIYASPVDPLPKS